MPEHATPNVRWAVVASLPLDHCVATTFRQTSSARFFDLLKAYDYHLGEPASVSGFLVSGEMKFD
jgi:hypothetical protein